MDLRQGENMAAEMNSKIPTKRYDLLDNIRGITLVSMVAYHAVWDLVYIFGVDMEWFRGTGGFLWQQSICWMFIFLSGFCTALGRRSLRRGLIVCCAGVLISLATLIWTPDTAVKFGVLMLLGVCMVLAALLRKPLYRIPVSVGLAASLTLFILTRNINDGYLGFGGWNLAALPVGWYRNGFTTWLGFPASGFFSADYFSLVPWCFLFLTGYFSFRLCKARGTLSWMTAGWGKPLIVLGRHSLMVYLIHQPVLYILFTAVKGICAD